MCRWGSVSLVAVFHFLHFGRRFLLYRILGYMFRRNCRLIVYSVCWFRICESLHKCYVSGLSYLYVGFSLFLPLSLIRVRYPTCVETETKRIIYIEWHNRMHTLKKIINVVKVVLYLVYVFNYPGELRNLHPVETYIAGKFRMWVARDTEERDHILF
jgi:hypothetical protein